VTSRSQAASKENVNVLALKGYLDAHTAHETRGGIPETHRKPAFQIVVNCKDLSYISQRRLGVFMAFIEDVRQNMGDIKLDEHVAEGVQRVRPAGFPLLYEIFKEENEAINRFFDKPKVNCERRQIQIESRTERLSPVRELFPRRALVSDSTTKTSAR